MSGEVCELVKKMRWTETNLGPRLFKTETTKIVCQLVRVCWFGLRALETSRTC